MKREKRVSRRKKKAVHLDGEKDISQALNRSGGKKGGGKMFFCKEGTITIGGKGGPALPGRPKGRKGLGRKGSSAKEKPPKGGAADKKYV